MNDADASPGRPFWFGVAGLVANRADTKPLEVASRFAELALVHDAVIAPLAFFVGAVAAHWLPSIARGPIRGALALSAIVLVFSLPLVQRLGARQNSSVLPLAYGANVAVVLGAVWLAAVAVIGLRVVRRRRRRPGRPELSPERGA
jgi:hypothetical protein